MTIPRGGGEGGGGAGKGGGCLPEQSSCQASGVQRQHTYDGLHTGPHGVKCCVGPRHIVDVLLEDCHADRLRGLAVLRPQVHNVLLQARQDAL